jgi:nucleotide-binding universal stress UspA family protein
MSQAIRNILVPFDFSPAADRALEWAAALHEQLAAGTVHVVHVWNLMPAAIAGAPAAAGPTEEDVHAVEQDLLTACRRHGLEAAVSVEVSTDIGAAILEKAAELSSDLIVMGTHGRGGLTRAVLGSVADWLMRHARCPVTVLRSGG